MTDNALNTADAKVLAENPDAGLIDLILPDSNGLLRGKRITRDALEKVYENGVCLPMSLLATDVTGNTVEESGLGYDIGDEDRICRPIPGTLRTIPWQNRPMLQCLLSMEGFDGGQFSANPREVLKRVVQKFYDRGLTPVVAVELDEGVRMVSTIVDCPPADLRRGLRVRVVFDAVTDTVTLPRFERDTE